MTSKTVHHYDDGTHRFSYTVLLKPRLKHRYIRIRNGEVIVTAATRTSDKILGQFVTSKATWITKYLEKHDGLVPYDLTQPDAQLYWRGKSCKIIIEPDTRNQLSIEEHIACFSLKDTPDHDTMLSLVHRHRKEHAAAILLPRVTYWAAIMDLHPTRVSFRRARTRWGSCSARNTLSLNTHLLMLPDPLVDYVIVHELAHIQHKNHSKMFWQLVETYLPDWKKLRKMIREYEKFLI